MMTAPKISTGKLLAELITVTDSQFANTEVSGIALDSRQVKAGDVFLACAGYAVDGRDYIDLAIAAGAAAVLVEQDHNWSAEVVRNGVPVLPIKNLSKKTSNIAGHFFDNPSQQLPVIAVTGTNGKTSCTQLISQLLNQLGKHCGVIGTLGSGVDGELNAGINTTPDAVTIQQTLAQWHEQKIAAAAMEVSSHGLEQRRVAGLQFELAVFTNISRDHLDYHGSMQAYAEAKARLFKQPGLKKAVINVDDDYSDTLASVVAASVELIRFSLSSTTKADVWVENITYHSKGVSADLHSPWGQYFLNVPLLGAFNLSNMLAAICSLALLNYPMKDIVKAVAHCTTITGRMQLLSLSSDINVVVDYAHTPDALEKALQAIRHHTAEKLWCVFGCGGNRDAGKRPLMGAVVERNADHVIITSDNPRNESASSIIDEILSGVDRPSLIEEDRALAIDFAISHAATGDCVLIAGKGHEDYQLIGDQRIPFSDIKQARLALARRSQTTVEGQE